MFGTSNNPPRDPILGIKKYTTGEPKKCPVKFLGNIYLLATIGVGAPISAQSVPLVVYVPLYSPQHTPPPRAISAAPGTTMFR